MQNQMMTAATAERETLPQRLYSALKLLDHIPHDLIALIARLSIATVFWQSG